MCLNVIKVAVELANSLHVSNYVSKAESTPDLQVRLIGFMFDECAGHEGTHLVCDYAPASVLIYMCARYEGIQQALPRARVCVCVCV
jgi:hypothetical protein